MHPLFHVHWSHAVLVDMQNDASQLKQQTDDLKQQLLAAQVRHNRISIHVCLRWKIQY